MLVVSVGVMSPTNTRCEAQSVTNTDLSDVGSYDSDSSQFQAATPVNTEQKGSANETWVEQFEIPWSKCRPTLAESLKMKTVPLASDIRELISHTMSDIFGHTRRPSRKVLRFIAQKIVR